MSLTYQNIEETFSAENIRNCEEHIFSIQSKLDKAIANNDIDSIQSYVNILARKSSAVKILATWRITQRNQGKYTAGVDGIAMPQKDRQLQYQMRYKILKRIDINKKPDPIRRVYIPKPNGKQRPLGIPTLQDRIHQEIIRIAIEPIVEYHFNSNSYGFRPKRSCQDAQAQLFNKLVHKRSPRYIIEGDIKGCFDNINHEHIIETLLKWKVPKWTTEIINKWLKTNIFHNGEVYDSETGTPQGGVISPLLANVALTTLDDFCFKNYGYTDYQKNRIYQISPLVRYADDFIITCKSELEAKQIKKEIAIHLKEKVGLTLSEEKTKITHITQGFNFLGFNFRKYQNKGKRRTHLKKNKTIKDKWDDYILLIKPEKAKIKNLLQECKEVLKSSKTVTQKVIILLLNPKLRGWAMYYRHVVSKEVFNRIDYEIWWKLFHWSKRRHPNKSKSWIIQKYFSQIKGKSSKIFRDKETNSEICELSRIPIRRFIKVDNSKRVFDSNPDTQKYWQDREYINAYKQIDSVKMRRLYESQKGICPHCKGQMTLRQIQKSLLHTHHIKPRSKGGNNNYSNLQLIHAECHREIHAN